MRSCSSAAAATSFQNLTTTSSTRGPVIENRVSFIRGVGFWNPPPEIQIGVLRSQTLVGGSTDGYLPNLAFIRRNPLLPAVASSSSTSESQVELDIANEVEIQTQLPDQDDSPTVHIRLQLHRECHFGEQFLVVGDHPALGMWDPMDAAPMVWSDRHVWTAELDMPAGKLIQFKFILRDISGEVLWQPGPNRVLQSRETSKIIVVFGDWEKVAVRQVTEERINDDQYEESDELMICEKKQLTNDEAESNNKKEKPHLESCNGSIAPLNAEEMAMVVENIELHTLQESGYLRVERKVEVSRIEVEVEAQRFDSQAVKEEVAISNKALERSKVILETKQEIPVLVPGLTPCIITAVQDATVTEEELDLDTFDNARNAMAENSGPECLHHNGPTQIQLDQKQEGIEGHRENEEEEEEEVQEVIAEVMFDKEHALIEYPNKPASVNSHEPDQGFQLILFEGQDNRSKGILDNDFKWGLETLRRFLDKLGFRLQI